ncbi:MAG: hypothetical protein ACM3Q1_05765 [Bacteroidales bacterium]
MATLLQRIGSAFGLGDSEPLVSGNTVTQGTTNAAFHLDIHGSSSTGEQILIAGREDAVIAADPNQRALIIGGAGDDRLTGGEHADLLIGGGGRNVLIGGGGTDTFGHALGARDVVADFSPAAGEHIALQSGMTLTGATSVQADPGASGLSGGPVQSMELSFSDGSHMTLLGVTQTPSSDWFV